ncbi:MAG TPA: TonB-dependent receptor [Lacunisphaera sp.]
MNTNLQRTLLAVLLSASVTKGLIAQDLPKDDSPPKEGEVLELERFKVTSDVATEQLVLPIARPFNSVFGTDDNIVDVPRNVTIISRQQLSDINISSVLDFSKLTSSAYTTTNFGAPSNPSIRGQTADLFINGMRGRITSNGNGLPLNFNSIESVNIVKGPATAVQGTSMYVGGFIDLITKRPYFDKTKGSVSATIGSYSQKAWTVDVGGPLSKTVAYRVSYSGEDSKGYWHDYFNKNHTIYGALELRPSSNYNIFLSGSWSDYRYTENWGINRVTQDLIDNGNYVTGININNAPGAPSDAQNSTYVLGGGNVMAWGPTVKLNRHERLLKPGDHSKGKEYNLQAVQTYTVDPTLKVVNNTFWSYTDRNTLSSYYYSEIIDPSWFAENRTEVIFSKPFASINTGIDLRYQRTKAYDDYFFEPANVWDLTKDHKYINVYNSGAFYGRFVGQPVPGWPNRYATQGAINGDTNDSHGTTVGPFFQATWKLNPNFDLVTGGRYDHLSANVKDPLGPFFAHDTISVWIPNYNASLVYKMTKTSSAYVTYNYSKNTSGAVGNGGGITGWNGAGTELDKENFQQPSELWEAGTKYSLKDNTLFLNFAVYQQERTAKSTSSTDIVKFKAKGFEAELNYQPSKHFYMTASYSFIDATVTPGFQSDGGTPLLPTQGIDYANTHQVSGLPKNQFNTLFSYGFDNGLTLTANGTYTTKINNNYAGTLVIPSQYEIDLGAEYKWKSWDYRLTISNVTNEENWSPPNAVYGNGSIFAKPGTQLSFTAKYSF